MRKGGWRWIRSGLPWGDGNLPEFSEVVVDVGDQLGHSQLGECDGEVFLDLVMDGLDHRDPAGDALFGGSEGKEISKALVLEVGLVEGPEWGVDIEVAIKRDDKVRVMEVSEHVMEYFWGGGVCAETVGIQRDIHQHNRASGSGSGGSKRKGRNSID